ncbi:putative aminoglycoside phosphotransferase [Streptomyces ambofaciens ATCC 23877]|uniref:Putative aminoglycoside phosphotransferase n=1 Tax=Streptomyces ambofaciens (strain ATCC 23877 / 3486 / DSM 40053 / JCM 4204 / NBRC 12836 / NRRL B-2516) TaxID=278992 RepID=Q1RQZ5_STRA7|nr:aminoglycoside phosphotransferase family protein [Streptomyces ambofaciens]AKZ53167.1 putative aminoglycoside phosphotransferase [Streptomyces ambofaciens ATCC 23877]AKZ60596.1 putative aminoglycoside phosphotransferase [Streptomyces ambofaciens ATCC 23877]CAI78020.1 putative aminoglycoside phosphotransferase [Streptomyces ambofaciens ATCC 23877]CAI78294.1 putative aminoglycoside phosphotransferase [Streptomyces ambofaciens ATCC 23877]CAJ87799.1 putative aminoglycoside phosphotransferase [S
MVAARTAETRPQIDEALVRCLVDTQFPQWADLALKLLDPAGSDHVIYRLGEELSVRLPRHPGAIGQARKESQWLPQLAPHLPLAIPVPVAVGGPGFGYPWPWAVSRWLDGEVATVDALGDSPEAAIELARFLAALQRFPLEDIPAGDAGEALTGRPLSDRDRATRAAIAEVDGVFDTAAMTQLWNAALSAPGWDRSPVWFHGDFHTGNLLTSHGCLSAVIDFGGLGTGDPACDLMIAFTLMSADSRAAFRDALGVDDATWMRGRGWALATGLNAYTSYAAVNPRVAAQTTRQITHALVG